MNQLFVQYSYLQILDLMTTVAFLIHGVQEANPLMRLALKYAPHPLQGLLAVKFFALGLGFYCWRCGRQRLLKGINVLFALVVVWNMLALIVSGLAAV